MLAPHTHGLWKPTALEAVSGLSERLAGQNAYTATRALMFLFSALMQSSGLQMARWIKVAEQVPHTRQL